ncbi:unnamed protein product [Acanthoscelides obtectus]|uniref:Uncharacterized protein n=1 Tax=Acanthoscelides obtectus TaxID=200917 RepID=A0A9P0Q7B1_ACAOB|nr:unnamed protein product [Acanthoscelides obtectus]CAK1641210.1 hypothetical protein AOBTE_LOCUS12240 [Acanthoscelides obtectus]
MMSPILSKKAKVALAVGKIILLESEKKEKRVWVKEWLQKREQFTHLRLLKCIQSCEPLDVINYLRMDYEAFQELLMLVKPLIKKKNTLFREAVSVEERLLATLRFLATGRSYEEVFLYNFSSVTWKNNSRNVSCYIQLPPEEILMFSIKRRGMAQSGRRI